MSGLGTMEIFKLLPGAKRESNANCKKCGCSTCMMFAVKLSKGAAEIDMCPYATDELKEKFLQSQKIQQKQYNLDGLIIGGENVLYRHEKTFLNPCPFFVSLDCNDSEFISKLKRISGFEIESVGVKFKVDGIYLKNSNEEKRKIIKDFGLRILDDEFLSKMQKVEEKNLSDAIEKLVTIRKKAILERNEAYINPTFVHLKSKDINKLCVQASSLICKYASLIIFDTFDEALFTSLITLRQNIYTDPQKPLQVESKVYVFNNPDENALVFLTTNFALSYFAVANELGSLKTGSYLVITPSEGMSVLTAWSAEKITAEIASKIVNASNILDNIKAKRLIIPGLLSDLKEDLTKALPQWEIIVGTVEAYKIPDFVKQLNC